MAEKEQGNACYKKKDLDGAIEHYSKAIELDPTDITFRSNKAGETIYIEASLHLYLLLLKYYYYE